MKVIICILSSETSQSPTVPPEPKIIFNPPSGKPASIIISPNLIEVKGVKEAGFKMTEHPAAMAGATLCDTRFRGKLKGEIAPTTPTGNRIKKPTLFSPPTEASKGTVCPKMSFASSEANLKV